MINIYLNYPHFSNSKKTGNARTLKTARIKRRKGELIYLPCATLITVLGHAKNEYKRTQETERKKTRER